MHMQVKHYAWIAAALCILSALFYIFVMIFAAGYDLQLSSNYYFQSYSFRLVFLMVMFTIITLILILRAAVKSRGFRDALIIEAIYLVFLALSLEKIYHGVYSLLRMNGYAHSTIVDMFFLIIIFIPCMLSLVFEACACVKAKSQTKSCLTQDREGHI